MVCGLEYADQNIEDQLAMAIGDEFSPRSLGAFDWAQLAHNCKLSPRLVARQLQDICSRTHEALPIAAARVVEEGGARDTVSRVSEIVKAQASMLESLADKVVEAPVAML
jgi:serine/threonine-protein kinase HipA